MAKICIAEVCTSAENIYDSKEYILYDSTIYCICMTLIPFV